MPDYFIDDLRRKLRETPGIVRLLPPESCDKTPGNRLYCTVGCRGFSSSDDYYRKLIIMVETLKGGSFSIAGKVAGGLILRSATLRITPVNRFRVARCSLRTEVFPRVGWKSADVTYQRVANPVQSGASVPVTFVPGPRAPKTERVPVLLRYRLPGE